MEENNQIQKYTRVQEKGQVTLPVNARRKYGLKKGDLVSFKETPDGLLIIPSEVITKKDIDNLDEILQKEGITFDELIESGREIRGEIIKEEYGLPQG